jgi:hypothetical protein
MRKKTIDITIGCNTATVAFTCGRSHEEPTHISDFNADFSDDFGTSLLVSTIKKLKQWQTSRM